MKKLDKNEHKEALWLILKAHGVTEEQYEYIFKFVECKMVKRGYMFSEEGFTCKHIGILLQGDLYAHGSNALGEKRNTRFFHFPVNIIVTSYDSFDTATASIESITALSDSIIYVLTLRDLNTILEHFPALLLLQSSILKAGYNDSVSALKDIKELNDSEWLKKLEKEYPYLLLHPFRNLILGHSTIKKTSYHDIRNALGI